MESRFTHGHSSDLRGLYFRCLLPGWDLRGEGNRMERLAVGGRGWIVDMGHGAGHGVVPGESQGEPPSLPMRIFLGNLGISWGG